MVVLRVERVERVGRGLGGLGGLSVEMHVRVGEYVRVARVCASVGDMYAL